MTGESVIAEEARAEEAGAQDAPRSPPRVEAAEIWAWRVEKVRRWPRRARILSVRIIVCCICAVTALVVLEQVISLTTAPTQGVSRSNAPHQK